jgi:hypothetical protein
MAWICVDLDDTLLMKPVDPMTGESDPAGEATEPTEGSVETMAQLAGEGHRLTVFTARFAPMPESEKQRMKEQIEQELQGLGFPPMEVWTGTTKPSADVFIDDKAITYDNDWGLVLAQLEFMLSEHGLTPPAEPGAIDGMGDDGQVQEQPAEEQGGGEPPQE